MYKRANGRLPPAKLQDLLDAGYIDRDLLRCPIASRSVGIDYFYFPQPDEAAPGALTACDFRENHRGEGRAVLTAIGHIKFVKEADFQAYLSGPENAECAKALRAAERARPR